MSVIRNEKEGKISIDQSVYIEKILKRFNMMDANPAPLDLNQKLSEEMY